MVMLFFVSCGKKGDPMPKKLPIPGGINDLKGEVKDGMLFLSFSTPFKNIDGSDQKDLAGFKIFKACGSCMGEFEFFKDLSLDNRKGFLIQDGKVSFYDNEVMAGFQYVYKVYPYTKKGTRGDPSNIFIIQWEKTPDPVKDVSVKESDGKVELSWKKEEGFMYNVYRYDDNIYPLFPLNKAPFDAPYFFDKGLENGKTYAYEVRKVQVKEGIKREGEGIKISATPKDMSPPAVPSEVKAEKKDGGVLITWKENTEEDFEGYNIYRINSGKAEKLNDEPLEKNMYFDKNIPDNRYISYYVTSLDETDNESEPSREVIIIVKEQ
jgi:fibronectin type 3 domain-containing protein